MKRVFKALVFGAIVLGSILVFNGCSSALADSSVQETENDARCIFTDVSRVGHEPFSNNHGCWGSNESDTDNDWDGDSDGGWDW